MDIYQETFEQIELKLQQGRATSKPAPVKDDLDMYADDFDEKEKKQLGENEPEFKVPGEKTIPLILLFNIIINK